MRKFFNILFLFPVAVILILLSVANRQFVQFSVDPFNPAEPALAITLPFFVFLFVALLAGAVIGGFVTWFSQGKNRRELRRKNDEVRKLRRDKEEAEDKLQPAQKEIAPGLPVARLPDRAA